MEQTDGTIRAEDALAIARIDAERMYHDLSDYRVSIELHPDGWHVEYHVEPAECQGGGPYYVIDPTDGTIKSKKYYQ